jgi:hypothetical protein
MELVKVVKDFISEDSASLFINLINDYETDHKDYFQTWQDGKRIAMLFGNVEADAKSGLKALPDLSILKEKEQSIRDLISKIILTIRKKDGLEKNLYPISFWLAKQHPGAIIPKHSDAGPGYNNDFEYSVILYLNKLSLSGKLYFPDLDVEIFPNAGDLIYFPTQKAGNHLVESILEKRYSLVLWLTADKAQTL